MSQLLLLLGGKDSVYFLFVLNQNLLMTDNPRERTKGKQLLKQRSTMTLLRKFCTGLVGSSAHPIL